MCCTSCPVGLKMTELWFQKTKLGSHLALLGFQSTKLGFLNNKFWVQSGLERVLHGQKGVKKGQFGIKNGQFGERIDYIEVNSCQFGVQNSHLVMRNVKMGCKMTILGSNAFYYVKMAELRSKMVNIGSNIDPSSSKWPTFSPITPS